MSNYYLKYFVKHNENENIVKVDDNRKN